MKRHNVVSISEYDGWHQLAEMQREPKPNFNPSKRDWKQIGAGTIILVGVAIVAALACWEAWPR